eukprot:809109-Rhodomonas_salina.1
MLVPHISELRGYYLLASTAHPRAAGSCEIKWRTAQSQYKVYHSLGVLPLISRAHTVSRGQVPPRAPGLASAAADAMPVPLFASRRRKYRTVHGECVAPCVSTGHGVAHA